MNVEQNQGHTLKTKLLIKDKEDTLDCDFFRKCTYAAYDKLTKGTGVCESRLLD